MYPCAALDWVHGDGLDQSLRGAVQIHRRRRPQEGVAQEVDERAHVALVVVRAEGDAHGTHRAAVDLTM